MLFSSPTKSFIDILDLKKHYIAQIALNEIFIFFKNYYFNCLSKVKSIQKFMYLYLNFN